MLEKAIAFAATKHDGQLDKSGKPYILYCLAVMSKCSENNLAMIVAVLHDTVEDTQTEISDIALNFGPEVVTAVRALTKTRNESYDSYLERVKTNDIAVMVKIADLEHNMEPSRMTWDVSDKDAARMAKYTKAYGMLTKYRSYRKEIANGHDRS